MGGSATQEGSATCIDFHIFDYRPSGVLVPPSKFMPIIRTWFGLRGQHSDSSFPIDHFDIDSDAAERRLHHGRPRIHGELSGPTGVSIRWFHVLARS